MRPASGLLALTFHLVIVSSISFGGFPTVLPDVRAFVVTTHSWMTDQDFTNIFVMAQAIPGPNMILMMGLIGWKVWGLAGAFAASTTTLRHPARFILLRFA
jgi:chromate transporter